MIYLNQAGTSWPKPGPVRDAVADALEAPVDTWASRLEAQHRRVCEAFGVADPGRMLLTPGATSALAVGIADHPWRPGDRILVSGLEHHALHRPALLLRERGVEVRVAPRAVDGPVDLDAVGTELRRGGVRLLAMTAASNVTGECLPVEELVALAHAHGALALVDAAQVAGWVPLDVSAMGADLLAFTGHKGPQAPWGIGGLYVAPGVRMSPPRASCEAGGCDDMPGYCDVGSVDRAALAGLVAGLAWMQAPQRRDRLAEAQRRIARLAEAIAKLPGLRLHGTVDPAARMPTLAVSVAGRAPADLAAALAARDVLASGGQQCAPLAHETLGTAPDGVLRFSVGPANTDDDVDAAAEALSCVLKEPS